MQRDQARRAEQADAGQLEADAGVTDAPRVSYSSRGVIPKVGDDFHTDTKSASDRACVGPGLQAVHSLRDPRPGQVAEVIEKHPQEINSILDYVRTRYGGAFSGDVAHILQDHLDKAKKPQLSGPGFKVGDQQFQFPMPALKTKDGFDKVEDDKKLETDRAAQEKGDKAYDPTSKLIDQKLHGAPPKSKEQQRNEDKLTQSLEAGQADGGVAGVVHKRYE